MFKPIPSCIKGFHKNKWLSFDDQLKGQPLAN
jgi:hypothetical protein